MVNAPVTVGSGEHRVLALHVLANAGHYPMFETPAALVASIEGFLDQG